MTLAKAKEFVAVCPTRRRGKGTVDNVKKIRWEVAPAAAPGEERR